MAYSLIENTDKWMTRQRISLPRPSTFYPSEASVSWTDSNGIKRTAGACLRQVWYRLTAQPGFIKPDAYAQWIFALGKAVEAILIEEWKQMGVWVDNNVKFYNEDTNISGEIDAFLTEPGGVLHAVEVKSFAGYQAKKEIIGNKGCAGAPKVSQMLQALIYTDLGRTLKRFNYTKMVYYARDTGDRTEFDIDLVDTNGHLHPLVNGKIDSRFTMQDIYDRYALLKEYWDSKQMPPRDYDINYDIDKVHLHQSVGDISKTAFEDWKKNPAKNPIGDWQCRYCGYRNICAAEGV
jgi:hypothetical protein